MERGLPLGGTGGRAAAQDPIEALQATAAGVYDTMIKVAARLSRVQERLAEAKEAFLADRAAVSSACPHHGLKTLMASA